MVAASLLCGCSSTTTTTATPDLSGGTHARVSNNRCRARRPRRRRDVVRHRRRDAHRHIACPVRRSSITVAADHAIRPHGARAGQQRCHLPRPRDHRHVPRRTQTRRRHDHFNPVRPSPLESNDRRTQQMTADDPRTRPASTCPTTRAQHPDPEVSQYAGTEARYVRRAVRRRYRDEERRSAVWRTHARSVALRRLASLASGNDNDAPADLRRRRNSD